MTSVSIGDTMALFDAENDVNAVNPCQFVGMLPVILLCATFKVDRDKVLVNDGRTPHRLLYDRSSVVNDGKLSKVVSKIHPVN